MHGKGGTMTEDEAKTKWCPMKPIGYADEVEEFTCVASACMMWRWDETTEDNPSLTPGGTTEYLSLPIGEWEGHCGLGGEP
jgi:hypothetical protein